MNIQDLKKEKYEIKGKKFYSQINQYLEKYHLLMSHVQMGFLSSLIEQNKFNNILEIGVFQGVNSIFMLKAGLSSNDNFNLYSIDLATDKNFYGKVAMDTLNDKEKEHYHLFLGKNVFDIEEIIPENIKFDLVFIDAAHSHPLSLLDLIYSIPYLNKDALIFLHDIIDYDEPAWGESYIFEAWSGDKYRLYDYDNKVFSNMGCIKLHDNPQNMYKDLKIIAHNKFMANPWFVNNYNHNKYNHNNMTVKAVDDILTFGLGLEDKDLDKIKIYMDKHYDKIFSYEILEIFKHNLSEYKRNCLYNIHQSRLLHSFSQRIMNLEIGNNDSSLNKRISNLEYGFRKVIDSLAWWIPIRKWRDNFRNKLFDKFIGGGVEFKYKYIYSNCFILNLNQAL